MKIECDIDLDEILKQSDVNDVAEFYSHRRDIDELLRAVGTAALVRYLKVNESPEFILDEMCEVSDVRDHVEDLQRWLKEKAGA